MMAAPTKNLHKRLEIVETYLANKRKELHLPGLSVAIVQNGDVVYTRGLGKAGSGRVVTTQTPFLLGSLSKSFTALAVMQLVESGKLQLDTPVQDILPWFSVADRLASSIITVRYLLTHTSGFSRYAGRDLLAGRGNRTVEQSVRALSHLRLMHAPGTQFEYSNLNYVVLAGVIEAVSGLPYPSYVERFIFQPLSMHESAAAPVVPDLTQGYRWWFGWPVKFDAPYLFDAQAAAFLSSSVGDMARWLLLHLSGGALDGVRLLSARGMETLHTGAISTQKQGSYAAMGWRIEELAGEVILRHGGEVSNFRSDMILLPERKLGVVVLQNCNNGLVAHLGLDQIALNIVRLLVGLPLPRCSLSLSCFSFVTLLLMFLFSFLQVVLWPFLMLHMAFSFLQVVLVVLDMLWPFLALWGLPRVFDMSWRGLKLYVPDVSLWMIGIGFITLMINCFLIVRWFL